MANAREECRQVEEEKAEAATTLNQLKEEYAGSRSNWESADKQHNEEIQVLTHQQDKLKDEFQSQIEMLGETLDKAEAQRASHWQSETGQLQEHVQSLTQRNQELQDESNRRFIN